MDETQLRNDMMALAARLERVEIQLREMQDRQRSNEEKNQNRRS